MATSDGKRQTRPRTRWLALILVGAVMAFPGCTLRTPSAVVYGPGKAVSDLTITFWPNVTCIQQTWQTQRQIPLWRTFIFCGTPFNADPQSGLWYVPNILFLVLPAAVGFNLLFVAHILAGGLGMWARATGTPPGGALLAALAHAFAPRVFAHLGFGHVGLVYAAAYVPWVLWATLRVGRGHRPGVAVLRLALGWQCIAHPQTAFYTGLAAAAYGPAVAYARRRAMAARRDARTSAAIARGVAAAGGETALGIGLAGLVAAAQLLPMAGYAPLTGRATMGFSEAALSSLPRRYLLGLLVAYPCAFIDYVVYCGLPVLVLALVALRRRRGRYWLVCVLLALLFAVGTYTPLYRLAFALIPPLGWLRAPSRVWFVAVAALTLAAGWGFDELRRMHAGAASRCRTALNLGVVALGLAAAGLAIGYALWFGRPPANLIALGIVAPTTAVLVVTAGPNRRGWGTALWIALVLADLWVVDATLVEGRSIRAVFSDSGLGVYLAKQQESGSLFRVYSPSYSLPRQIAAQYRLETADGVDPLYLEQYAAIMELASGVARQGYGETIPAFEGDGPLETLNQDALPNPALLGLPNVRYVAAEFPINLTGLREVTRFGSAVLYENASFLPRAFTVGDVATVDSFGSALAWLRRQGAEQLARAAVVQGDGRTDSIDYAFSTVHSEIVWLRRSPNRQVLDVTLDREGFLVLSQARHADWKARVDGHAVTLWQTDGVLSGVSLPASRHTVTLEYRAHLALAGGCVTLTTLAGLAVAGAITCTKRRAAARMERRHRHG